MTKTNRRLQYICVDQHTEFVPEEASGRGGTWLYHENSVDLSSTTNPKPKGQPSISLPAQANLNQQKAEPLRCLALKTRGGR